MISNNISFGAKFLSSSTIQKYDRAKNIFVDKGVSLVQFEPQNRSDKLAIKIANNKWGRYFIGQSIYLCADMLSKKEASKEVNKILMLTEQTDNFKKLDATKILALSQTQQNKNLIYDELILDSSPSSKRFYIKQGFELVDDINARFLWKK